MNEIDFKKYALDLGIELSVEQLNKLEMYYELLIEWNEKINLTAITKKEDVYLKHFYDSLTLSTVVDLNDNRSLCDIGTGAGFPGIVLKICFPSLKITLVDALQKRINFLNTVIDALQLENITTVHERAELFAKNHREEYDIVTARAVSKLNILLEYALPMTKINGIFVAMKANVGDEIEQSSNALKILNSEVEKVNELKLPIENSTRTLIRIKKLGKTPLQYPRNFDKISKKTL